jgi:hypothetical protein
MVSFRLEKLKTNYRGAEVGEVIVMRGNTLARETSVAMSLSKIIPGFQRDIRARSNVDSSSSYSCPILL